MPIQFELLKEIKVRDLGEEHQETLEELLEVLDSDLRITPDKNLAFLSELWLAEKAKGRKANKKAIQQIEDIVFEAFAKTKHEEAGRKQTARRAIGEIQKSEIMTGIGEGKKPREKKHRKIKLEIEAKFAVPNEETFRRLQAIKEIAGFELTAGEVKQGPDIFLDTPDRRIFSSGYFCRKRSSPHQTINICALKGAVFLHEGNQAHLVKSPLCNLN